MLLRTDDLHPDGIRITIRWDKFVIGASLFVPCVNTTKAVQQLTTIASNSGQQITTKIVVENDMLGVRVWRTM
jgi:hypothetical protein